MRQIIYVNPEEHRINDEVLEVLPNCKGLFQRAGELVRVKRYEDDDRQALQITELPLCELRHVLTSMIDFRNDRGPIHPPDWCVAYVASCGRWKGVPTLRNTVECPVLRKDGTVLQVPGHDEKSGLLFEPNDRYQLVVECPTRDQVLAARDRLLELACDFPFAEEVHRSAWFAGVLTPFARHAYDGPTPLFLVDGNVRGSGKSLLCDAAALVATGRRAPRTTQVVDEAEERKRITAIARAGDLLMLIDNISRPFGNGSFDAALTSTTWKDRTLGSSVIRSYPLHTIWWGTGNNVQFRAGADTARRTLHMRLSSPEQNPESRTDFKFPDLVGHILEHRAQLVADALTVLRGSQVHKARAALKLPSWGSFERWSEVVRGAVVWCDLPDPIKAHEQLAQLADTTSTALFDFVDGWERMCKAMDVQACTAREAVQWLTEDLEVKSKGMQTELRFRQLHDAVGELCALYGRQLPDTKQLGYTLRSYKNRVVDGRYLDTAGEERGMGLRWAVKKQPKKA